jgi:hypothetical protein
MLNACNGFAAADLEESIAAPGTGEGVAGVMCTTIEITIDCTVTVGIIVACPPRWPPVIEIS